MTHRFFFLLGGDQLFVGAQEVSQEILTAGVQLTPVHQILVVTIFV
jgi:hypothetical protein